MTGQYLFTCPSCQATNGLSPKQAGQELTCTDCNEGFQAPKLGDIRKLPVRDEGSSKKAKEKSYSPLQGWLFSGGLTLAMVAGIAGWFLNDYASSLSTDVDIPAEVQRFNDLLDKQPPAEVYRLSRVSEDDIALEYEEPMYKSFNKQSEILTYIAYGLYALCGIGLLMMISSFLFR